MWRSLGLSLALLSHSAAAVDYLQTDLRYVSSSALRNTLEGTALARRTLFPWLDADIAGRIAASKRIAERLEYKGEAVVPILDFFSARARVSQGYRFNESVAATTLLLAGELRGSPVAGLELFAIAGWYERFSMLSDLVIIPYPLRNSYRDHDFAAHFGVCVRSGEWTVGASAGTLDEILVYNLDNPYIGITLARHPVAERVEMLAFARYKLLLGFGRLDELTMGVGLRWSLGAD